MSGFGAALGVLGDIRATPFDEALPRKLAYNGKTVKNSLTKRKPLENWSNGFETQFCPSRLLNGIRSIGHPVGRGADALLSRNKLNTLRRFARCPRARKR